MEDSQAVYKLLLALLTCGERQAVSGVVWTNDEATQRDVVNDFFDVFDVVLFAI